MCGGTEMKQQRDTQRTENNEGETHTAFTVEDIESVEDIYNWQDLLIFFLKIFFIKSFFKQTQKYKVV